MSTERKKERKRYDLEFKKQAVQLVLSSGRPLAEIARELGVSDWNLRDWRLRLQAQLGAQPDSVEALRLRVAQLERDNLQLREQRDILKKTLGIVSTP
jgi:transposase